MENNKNIFFFFDTFINTEKITEKSYVNALIENNPKFEGKYHYIVAGAKAIKDKLESKNQNIDSIICASDMGEKNKSYLTEELNKIFGDTIRIEWIKYQNTDNSDTILSEIEKSYKFSKNDTLYLLTNSGVRNNIMFFSTFTQIMVAKGLKTELIYVQEVVRNKEETIRNVSDNNRYFEVLRAVELFVQSGNPKSLKKIYDKNKDLKKLLSYMDNFYKNIQICRPVNQSDILDIYDDMIDEIDGLMEKDIAIEIKLLLPTIKEKFKPLGINYNEPFLQILKWCQENDMLLTGYFIMDAEYKKFLYDKKILQFNKDIELNTLATLLQNIVEKINEENKNSYWQPKGKISERLKKIDASGEGKEIYLQCYSDEDNNQKLYELILFQNLIRRIRNNMAHSDNRHIIGETEALREITDKIQNEKKNYPKYKFSKRIYNGKFESNNSWILEDSEDIVFTESGIYGSIECIFEISTDIIRKYIAQLEQDKSNQTVSAKKSNSVEKKQRQKMKAK